MKNEGSTQLSTEPTVRSSSPASARDLTVEGWVVEEFADLVDVLPRRLAQHSVGGAELCVFQHGELVADLKVGDISRRAKTLLFSVSKLLLAVVVHRLAERGQLELDAPVADVWPEFAAAGAHRDLTVRHILSHRSTLAALDVTVDGADVLRGADRDAVLAAAPTAMPSAAGYHAVTFGTVLGAVVENVTGSPLTQVLYAELGDLLGTDLALGDHRGVEPVRFSIPAALPAVKAGQRDGLLEALVTDPDIFNTVEFHEAAMPAMGMVGTAEALAVIMAGTIGDIRGRRVLDPRSVRSMTAPAASGPDAVLGISTSYASGPQLPTPGLPFTGRNAFGHEGAGGAVAFADPDLGLAVGYTTNLFPPVPGADPALVALLPTLTLLAQAVEPGASPREGMVVV